MARAEAPTGHLLEKPQLEKDVRRFLRKNANRFVEGMMAERDPIRRPQDLLQKRRGKMEEPSLLDMAKARDQNRRYLMGQLIAPGVLHQPGANPVKEAKLASELVGYYMESRQFGQGVDPSSLAARDGPPEVEHARQRRELESYL